MLLTILCSCFFFYRVECAGKALLEYVLPNYMTILERRGSARLYISNVPSFVHAVIATVRSANAILGGSMLSPSFHAGYFIYDLIRMGHYNTQYALHHLLAASICIWVNDEHFHLTSYFLFTEISTIPLSLCYLLKGHPERPRKRLSLEEKQILRYLFIGFVVLFWLARICILPMAIFTFEYETNNFSKLCSYGILGIQFYWVALMALKARRIEK